MKPRLTIIGLGRIGTSIGLALKKTGADLELMGHDKNHDALNAAQKMGAIDKVEWNLYNSVEGAGLILLALPLAGVLETIQLLKDDVAPGVIVTDTASIKGPVLDAAQVFKPGVHFIGGHPVFRPILDPTMANEPSAEIFQHTSYCLTPTPTTSEEAVQVMTGFVSMLGAKPLYLDAAEHDGLAAGAEHLAVALEAALLKTTTSSRGWRELNKFADEDYYTATQLAAGDAASATQLLLAQREPLSTWIGVTIQTLRELQGLLAQNDAAALQMWLAGAQAAREQWLSDEVGATTPAVDLSEIKSGAMRMFVGGLATRFGGDKKK